MDAKSKMIDRDDHYVKYPNGVVYDAKTGLEWLAGPGRKMSWYEAQEWARDLEINGGGWRMPTRKEFETLYQEGRAKRNMTRLLETDAWWAWSADQDGRLPYGLFDFSRGKRDWHARTPRVYAVRPKMADHKAF